MFAELPQDLIFAAVGAFLLGWILAAISARLNVRSKAKKRDPRDDKIRSLEAELRVAKNNSDSAKTSVDKLEDELKETSVGLVKRDSVITDQQSKIVKISRDLKDSVLKTRELRSELTDRATENLHAEAKIREVETELSVAQASTDMIATGVLDYSLSPDTPEGSDNDASAAPKPARLRKSTT
jgi:chromosome segregation ATPase